MTVDRNLAASFAGNAWTALVQIAFIPVYIDLLGAEAYGLIGVYAVLQSALVVLDLGLTPTLNREASRPGGGELRALLRSVEIVLAAIAIAILATSFTLARHVEKDWLQARDIGSASVVNALALMAALVAVRLFVGAYRGVIAGSQRFVWLNGVGAFFATLRGAGVVPVLMARPSIEVFFLWQLVLTVVEAVVSARLAWRLAPGTARPVFSLPALRAVVRFSSAMFVVSVVSLVTTQVDKLFLSGMVSLAEFGHYALAAAVASAILLAIGPVGSVAFPHLNRLVAAGRPADLRVAFHQHARRMTLAVAPVAMVLAIFAEPLLRVWTRDPVISAATAPLLTLLCVGTMLNAFMYVPYVLALAQGRAWRVAALTTGLLALLVPALYAGVRAHGSIAAAWSWVAVNAAGMALAFILPAELSPRSRWRWIGADVFVPGVAAGAGAWLVHLLFTDPLAQGGAAAAASIALAIVVALVAALLVSRVTSPKT